MKQLCRQLETQQDGSDSSLLSVFQKEISSLVTGAKISRFIYGRYLILRASFDIRHLVD